jgi:fatty-acyl-CoA synthase
VADVLGKMPGVDQVTVCGVHVPGMEGQAGLAALECDGPMDLVSLWKVAQELPSYAQPRFVRTIDRLDTTATFKLQKTTLKKEGVDPATQLGRVFLRQDDGYVPLTPELWRDVLAGKARL